MRIAFVTAHMTGAGGSETLIKSLVPALEAKGYDIDCYLPQASDDTRWEVGIHVKYLADHAAPASRALLRYDQMWGQALCWQDLWRVEALPDAVVAAAPFLCPVVRTAINFLSPRPVLISWAQVTLHALAGSEHQLPFADHHVAISHGVGEELAKIVDPETVRVIPNGTNVDVPPIKRAAVPTFLYVGRLDNKQKRLDKLFRALAPWNNREWKLYIIGQGRDEGALRSLALRLGIDAHIVWMGFHEQPFDIVDRATALVLPSDWEGFGMVLVEALARGLPVLASDCPVGPREIVSHGVNGWLFSPQDVDTLSRWLGGIIQGRVALPSEAACQQSAMPYSLSNMVAGFHRLFQEIQNGFARVNHMSM